MEIKEKDSENKQMDLSLNNDAKKAPLRLPLESRNMNSRYSRCNSFQAECRSLGKRCKLALVAVVVIFLLVIIIAVLLTVLGSGRVQPSEDDAYAVTVSAEYEMNGNVGDFTCPQGEFRCNNLTRCVAQQFQCNKIDDCGNNADEMECEHDEGWIKTFDEKIPIRVQPKREPSTECSLSGFPDVCICYENTSLKCVYANLTKVPPGISSNITHLNLRGNQIIFEDGVFEGYSNLQSLNLMDNGIIELPVDVFRGLRNLDKLYLSDNKIKFLIPGTFRYLNNVTWLFMSNNELAALGEGVFQGMDKLYWLMLPNNSISSLARSVAFRDTPSLVWFDISENPLGRLSPYNFSLPGNVSIISLLTINNCNISSIHRDTFRSFRGLSVLHLSHNSIKYFPSGLFRNLSKLADLHIDNNPATSLPEDLFDGLHRIDVLDLQGMTITNINSRMFEELSTLQHIEFSKFDYCRYAPHVRTCKPRSNGISSFEDLLKDGILRVSVWTIALLCFFGNVGVLISRFMMKAENRIHSLVVINLCTADFFMSIYLIIIGFHDVKFRNFFNMYALEWMQGSTCKFAGFLAMFSSEVSVFMLTFISLERFICIVYPYRLHRLTSKEATVVMSVIWFLGALVAWIPLISVGYFVDFYGSNGVCFPLHIHDPWLPGWEYSAFVFLGLNASCFTAIAISYTGMFISIQRTRKATTNIGKRGDMNYAKRFLFVVLTDALCWLPIAILKILSLCSYKIPATLYGWIIVFVLPINSALNPILYTISTTSFSQWFHKHVKLRRRGEGRGSLRFKNEFSSMGGRLNSNTDHPTEYSTVPKRSYDSNSSPVAEEPQCSSV
ncbi:relaxin receptor 1-like isoform X1 [Asterias rubens]|uniref:relaxin receptor 1-like isoform X1 n=1 Tax=Asterias rubens TaxID=7604 RepID=UPI001454FF73|nr:relaxin receptor 1-like isoform X1 [Asterias rubens]XP_033631988.1 relaxin receptor 1-like isoform X1 [Asterias rubens]